MRIFVSYLIRAAAVALAVVLLSPLLSRLAPIEPKPMMDPVPGLLGSFILPFFSALLMAAALAYPVSRSRLSGPARLAVVFLAVAGLNVLLTQIEAFVFLRMEPRELVLITVNLLIQAAFLSLLAIVLFPSRADQASPDPSGGREWTPLGWTGRLALCSFLYLVLYLTAGLLILPYVKAFYDSQGTLNINPALVLPLQLIRGALYVGVVLPLLRSMSVSRWQSSLAIAFLFPIVHAVSGLLMPNPYLPAEVRHWHMIEIGWSNFVYGGIVGFVFWNPRGGRVSREKIDAPAVAV
ncbi:MAG: hypothetical protein ACE5JX_07650 [Acidobacteriota bacterium]